MSRLRTRLVAVESKLLPKPPQEMLGSYELHYTEAWPGCLDYPEFNAVRCSEPEHGPACAAVITPISSAVRRVVVLQGAKAGPWLKLG